MKSEIAKLKESVEENEAAAQLEKDIQKLADRFAKIDLERDKETIKQIKELSERMAMLGTEMGEQKNDVNYIKAELKESYEQVESIRSSFKELKGRCAFVEVSQSALKNQFAQYRSNSQDVKESEMRRIVETSESVKLTADLIFKENAIIKKDINSIKSSLEGELQLLRSENESLLREHDRIYGKNRDVEGAFMHLIDEYKSIQSTKHKTLVSVSRTTVPGLIRSTPEKSLELAPVQPVEVARKNLTYVRKFRNMCKHSRIGEYLTKSFDSKTQAGNNGKGSHKEMRSYANS